MNANSLRANEDSSSPLGAGNCCGQDQVHDFLV